MSSFADTITDYYFEHFDELPEDKQFHYVSRLSAWNAEPRALQKLAAFRTRIVPDFPEEFLRDMVEKPVGAKINAASRRDPYFEKYPQLRGTMLALFRVRHLLFYYDVDIRYDLLEVVPLKDLYALSDALQNDPEALMILSTYAINYIYLVETILFPRGIDMEVFLSCVIDCADAYKNTPEDALLKTYLLTHCIIGQSNFYQSPVDTEKYPQYTQMLQRIERLIEQNFTAINLDNKCEFLVCSLLAGYSTTLSEPIHAEALQSQSPHGNFIVDTVNTAAQADKTSFIDSEHRNVLYIMSCYEFRAEPLSRDAI